ncbi:MAG: DUF1549 domain-containing protein [Bryobacteraceae bacterium]
MWKRRALAVLAGSLVWFLCQLVLPGQEPEPPETIDVDHSECDMFGSRREKFRRLELERQGREDFSLSRKTELVLKRFSFVPGASRAEPVQALEQMGTIDRHLFGEMHAAGVTPAPKATDLEFLRRITLDLTGRIPTSGEVAIFAADVSPGKRQDVVEKLLIRSEWVDKWTMYFGDLYRNSARTTQVVRQNQGRNAFYKWIRDSLAANKPYNTMAAELISAQGTNSWEQGEINWLVGGIVTGGPQQDIWDQQAANVAETFLGLGHMNCILCHNGRGHLEPLSLWGKSATRSQAWGLASFLSHSQEVRRRTEDRLAYWEIADNLRYRTDYALNTTTGNRPARRPIGTTTRVAPVYPFSGGSPNPSENYRVALAREVTSDFQFSRAIVNYIWKEFFTRGIVEPANQFDPARLDPDNPPTEPDWTLQPTNARLLNALAKEFADNGYNLKWLMRQIANSEAYQLSSRYPGEWKPEWEKLFARKLVRRLWAEEIHDAIVQSSNVLPSYNIRGFSDLGFPRISFAMQFPDPINTPDGNGAVSTFLNAFVRGDREDQERKSEGSLLQALNLMNDNFVISRIRGSRGGGLLAEHLSRPDDQLVANLFIAVLGRPPSEAERTVALDNLTAGTGTRTQRAENLLWSLYNKVDFFFNY